MNLAATPRPRAGWRRALKVLLAVDLVELGVFLSLVVVHAVAHSEVLGESAYVAGALLGLTSIATVSMAPIYGYLAYPALRKPIAFMAVLVVGTFLAHMYIIDNPPLGISASISGTVGSSVSDSQVTMSTVFKGATLTVTVTDSGSDAIGYLSVAVGSSVLPSSGLTFVPTATSALQPGAQDSGTWSLQSSPSAPVILNYEYLPCYDTVKEVDGCIMDESYYVPSAQTMLNGTQCGPTVPNCNMEHPFLSKALIAAGIAAFGNNAFGWRILNVIMGTFSLPLMFALVLRVSKRRDLAYISAGLLALDVMFFSQSSAALLDIPTVFFGLLAFVAYAYEARVWRLDRYMISGIFMGLAVLCKETAIFLVLALLTYHLLTHREGARPRPTEEGVVGSGAKRFDLLYIARVLEILLILCATATLVVLSAGSLGLSLPRFYFYLFGYSTVGVAVLAFLTEMTQLAKRRPEMKHLLLSGVELVCVSAAVFALGMQAYDSLFASHAFPLFTDQLRYIISYGSSLIGGGWTYGNHIQITPFSWMTYYEPVPYYKIIISVCVGSIVNGVCQGTSTVFPGVAYYGVTNFIETWTTYIWFPLAALVAWRVYGPVRRGLEKFGFSDPAGRTLTGDQKAAVLALVWFSWGYFPYVLLYAYGRVTYPFYIIPAVPAIALGAACFLTRNWVPRYAIYLYLAGAFAIFFLFFPSKAFFPDWLRALIGR
jgi:hypothetical protein